MLISLSKIPIYVQNDQLPTSVLFRQSFFATVAMANEHPTPPTPPPSHASIM